MTLQETGRLFRNGEARTLFMSIPSAIARDSAFPFDEEDDVIVRVHDDRLVIQREPDTQEPPANNGTPVSTD